MSGTNSAPIPLTPVMGVLEMPTQGERMGQEKSYCRFQITWSFLTFWARHQMRLLLLGFRWTPAPNRPQQCCKGRSHWTHLCCIQAFNRTEIPTSNALVRNLSQHLYSIFLHITH